MFEDYFEELAGLYLPKNSWHKIPEERKKSADYYVEVESVPWSGAPDMSGAPPDIPQYLSGAPGDSALNSSASGISRSRRAIIHRTVRCTPDSVRCSKGTRLWNLAASGNQNCCSAIIHRTCPVYTGLSGVHRTVRCNSGATAISAPTATCSAFNARQKCAKVRHARAGTPDIEQCMSGVHRTSRRAQKSEAPTVGIQRHW